MKQLKKYLVASLFLVFSFIFFQSSAHADDQLTTLLNGQQLVANENLPTTSLVIEAIHGQILWEENADQTIDPGYFTHLMTLYLAYEALHQDKISWNSTITATDFHQQISLMQYVPYSNIFVDATYPLEDLIKLVSFPTSTAASYLLAEMVTPDLNAFVTKMNETAQRLGMKQTQFYSPSGLTTTSIQPDSTLSSLIPENNNQSTPKDLALLAFHLINDFPEILDITQQPDVVVQGALVSQESFHNRNPFLFEQKNAIKGANGLMMDASNSQQTNGIFTVTQNGMTVISMLFGANEAFTTQGITSPMTIAGENLLKHIFDTYEYRVVAEKGDQSINQTLFHLKEDFGGVLPIKDDATLELSNDKLRLANHLPLVSDTLPEIATDYSKNAAKIEETVKGTRFLNVIVQSVEITQLTILSVGAIIIGFLFFLMSFFIPQCVKGEVKLENSRAARRKQLEEMEPTITRPFKKITFYSGILLVIAGVVSLIVQYLF